MQPRKARTISAFLLAAIAAVIAFFATCEAVTEGAVRIANPDPRSEALQANYILYGLFLGIPLGLAAAWFVARKVKNMILKRSEKK